MRSFNGADGRLPEFGAERWVLPILFAACGVGGWFLSGLSVGFVAEEVLTRVSRDTVLVLALVFPITAGMGLNFALPVGAMAAQTAVLTAACLDLQGVGALALTVSMALPLAGGLGWGIGTVLNRVRGREMIVSIVIGILGSNIYQLLFLGVPGRLVPVRRTALLLSTGSGLRNTVDLPFLKHVLRDLWTVEVGGIPVPLGALFVVGCFALGVHLVLGSRFGLRARAVADDRERAALCGVVPDRVRRQAMVASTVLGACGHLLYLQDLSILNVYTGHLLQDIFASAALLAGGATLLRASVWQALLGVVLFHTLFVVSPLAGQNAFRNAALGEYFRSFVAYGAIALAILWNQRDRRTFGAVVPWMGSWGKRNPVPEERGARVP